MDGKPLAVTPTDLYAHLGTASAPVVVDVRAAASFAADGRLIIGALHQPPGQVERGRKELPPGRSVVVYCADGNKNSQDAASALRDAGIKAGYLEGGILGWVEKRLPTRRNLGSVADKWVTREHPKIDRIACPWLVRRFINPSAQFVYVPPTEVLAVAKETGATPYDIKGVEFGHVGDRCSFDAIQRAFEINDPALDQLATIVRGADTSRPDLAPQCEGLLAISRGLSANFSDDHEMLGHGMVIYDALYTWCRSHQAEMHDRRRAQA